jgi:hypothetical protein
MSGGWKLSFNLNQQMDITVEFGYQFIIAPTYESNEFSDLIVSLDGNERQVTRVYGKSPTLSISETSWSEEWLNVAEGIHEIIIGAYNNQKTTINEVTSLCLEHIKITAVSDGVTSTSTTTVAAPTSIPTGPRILAVYLVDTDTNDDLEVLTGHTVLDRSVLPPFSLRAEATDVGSVVFLTNEARKTENFSPYVISGDKNGHAYPWNISPGNYEIVITPYSERSGQGTKGLSTTLTVAVV